MSQMFHLDPCFTKDRPLVPDHAMTEAEAIATRQRLIAEGIQVQRPKPVGSSPTRDTLTGERKPPPVRRTKNGVEVWRG